MVADTLSLSIEQVFSPSHLGELWEQLKASKQDAFTGKIRLPRGWDGVSVQDFDRQSQQHLNAISRRVLSGRYTFRPFLSHSIAKPDGGERTIAFSGIRDRIVQAAMHELLAPAVEPHLTDCAYAYRSGRGAHDAIFEIYSCAQAGMPFFVRSDFVSFFDRLEHSRLKALVESLEIDDRLRILAWRFVRTSALDRASKERNIPASRREGVPQGGVVSGVLSNLYLAEFDRLVAVVPGSKLIRYADDFVVMCASSEVCRDVFEVARQAAAAARLSLHSGDKTQENGHIDHGLEFVGFRVRGSLVSVKSANVRKFKARIDRVIAHHEAKLSEGSHKSARDCARAAIRHVNCKLQGVEGDKAGRSWIAFFRIVNDHGQLRALDRWVSIRIARMCRRLHLVARTRSEIRRAGYVGLTREYWRVRRAMPGRNLPLRGFVGGSGSSKVVEKFNERTRRQD